MIMMVVMMNRRVFNFVFILVVGNLVELDNFLGFSIDII